MLTIKQYLPQGASHRLLFTSYFPEDMRIVDLGALVARAIEDSLSKKSLPFIADEAIEDIIQKNICHSPVIGNYVAIRNIGILFEPALQLNICTKVSSWARSYALIIDGNEGVIKNNIFYLSTAEGKYSFSLSEISYNHYIQ